MYTINIIYLTNYCDRKQIKPSCVNSARATTTGKANPKNKRLTRTTHAEEKANSTMIRAVHTNYPGNFCSDDQKYCGIIHPNGHVWGT